MSRLGKSLYVVILSIFSSLSFAQIQKGATPINIIQEKTGTTKAVVIGISNYQDNGIPDLQYADQDAIAFSEWLKSKGGGSLQEDNLSLLLNEHATRAQINAALDGLIEQCSIGDLAIIYFSGHGDVETKTKFNRGFLLCYDSPPTNYPAGAFPIDYLQDIISTLTENKVKTIVIADACRSGKLIGNNSGGSQLTAINLARQYSNEIKILSCQPDEYSHEGEQWGGGRGAFSYYLVNGLFGLADSDHDLQVKLLELSRYLQENVSREVAPLSQIPLVVGNLTEKLAIVNKDELAQLERNINSSKKLSFTNVRGIEDNILATIDSITKVKYQKFKTNLVNKYFFCEDLSYDQNCAEALYENLSNTPALEPLFGFMRRNYAAALQDEVQQALNALLADDPFEFNSWYVNPLKYAQYPKYLARSIELLGKEHYSYPLLFSQQKYFEAYLLLKTILINEKDDLKRDSVRSEAKKILLEASTYSPDAAYIYFTIGNLHSNNHSYETDSWVKYAEKAIELAPGWLTPYQDLVNELLNNEVSPEKAEKLVKKALSYKPESYLMNLLLSWILQKTNRYAENDSICVKLIQKRPELFNAWSTMAQGFADRGDYSNSLLFAKKSITIEPKANNWAWQWYFTSLLETGKEKEALELITQNPDVRNSYQDHIELTLAGYYFARRNFPNALYHCSKLIASITCPLNFMAIAYLIQGKISFSKGNSEEALLLFEKAITTDPTPDVSDCLGRSWIGKIENKKGNYYQADSLFIDALNYPKNVLWWRDEAYSMYADFLLEQNRDNEAFENYQKAIHLINHKYGPYYGLAKWYAKKGEAELSLDMLQKALECWYPIPGPILEEPLFKKIRKTKRFKELIRKHFPDN